jgi:hypothetical protein
LPLVEAGSLAPALHDGRAAAELPIVCLSARHLTAALVLNGTTEIRGTLGEISGAHTTMLTALWLQTVVPLEQGDTVELQGTFRAADGYFAADHTTFWGAKVG